MASVKEYAYYIEGNKVAIVERDTAFDNNVDSKEYGPGVSRAMWKSPKTSVTDGLEIKYAYSPKYHINDLDDTVAVSAYTEHGGYLRLTIPSSSYTKDTYIVITGSSKFDGLHQVFDDTSSSVNLKLKTKYNGPAVTEAFTFYKDVDALNDENDELNIPSYLEKALVYYVKGRLAEDAGNIEVKEYMMREYKKHIETYETSLMKGPRIISSGFHAIR